MGNPLGIHGSQIREMKRCSWDFFYFCEKYLKILDKRGRLVLLKPNPIQKHFIEAKMKHRSIYVLKARKVGISTILAAWFYWKAMFKPGYEMTVVAHRDKAAKESLFPIYRRFHEHLPAWMKVPTKAAGMTQLWFVHDGKISVGTANSEAARGGTKSGLHCSEFSRYDRIDETIASLFSVSGDDAEIVLETTANGMNHSYSMWNDDDLGFHKVFYPWTSDPTCQLAERPKRIPPEMAELAEEFSLTERQLNWACQTYREKCANKWRTWLQEYPLEADQAFVGSGGRFFHAAYPAGEITEGYIRYEEPKKFHIYTIGVDTASGDFEGDYSSFCVVDVTNPKKMRTVATFYERISPRPFGKRVHAEAKFWKALVVPEANSYGLSVIEELELKNYAHIYHRVDITDGEQRIKKRLGFFTDKASRPRMLSKLHEALYEGWFDGRDRRFQIEANTFIYSDKGKPEAGPGKHDDMVFATALAVIGQDQIHVVRDEAQDRPKGIREILEYELATGRVYDQHNEDFISAQHWEDYDEFPLLGGSDRLH